MAALAGPDDDDMPGLMYVPPSYDEMLWWANLSRLDRRLVSDRFIFPVDLPSYPTSRLKQKGKNKLY
jgi:hypothetical protein